MPDHIAVQHRPHLSGPVDDHLQQLDIAASDIGQRMAQRQLTVDLHQLQSHSGSVAEDTIISRAGEVRNHQNT
jgi:hypothetical protein